jgi:hypothetical protein
MAVTPRQTVEGFSLSHAAILDGTTGAEHVDGDIYGVNEATLEPDTDTYDNEGDDFVLSTWGWLNYASLEVKGGYIPFKLITLLSGEATTSSGVAPNDYFTQLLWTDRSLNVAPRPVLIRIPSKDADGAVRSLEFVLFKVQFDPIKFEGPTYKDGLKINYSGRALPSLNNEAGVLLSTAYGVPVGTRAVARMVSRPAI